MRFLPFNFYQFRARSASVCIIYITPKGMYDVSRDLFQFWDISDNISLTVPDRGMCLARADVDKISTDVERRAVSLR